MFAAGISLMADLWSEKKSTNVIIALHLAYALGAIPTAQLTQLFDSRALENILASNYSSAPNGDSYHANRNVDEHSIEYSAALSQESNVTSGAPSILDLITRPMYPFDIAAIFSFLCGAVFLVFFGTAMQSLPSLDSPVVQKIQESRTRSLKCSSWFQGGSLPSFQILFYVLVFYVLSLTPQIVFGRWLSIILENTDQQQPLERGTCLLLQTIFWSSFALGRLLLPLAFTCLTPNGLSISSLTLTLVATAILCVYAYKFQIFLWIFVCVTGTFAGPIFPAGLTKCNTFISYSGMGVALAFSLSFLGEGLLTWQTAFLFEYFRPESLMYLAVAAAGASFLLYLPIIPVLSVIKWRPRKRKPKVNKKKAKRAKSLPKKYKA